jgi:hypothetical protein
VLRVFSSRERLEHQATSSQRLAVKHKGRYDSQRNGNDDNKEKNSLGQLWEERSDGNCVFYMPKGIKDIETIREKIKTA